MQQSIIITESLFKKNLFVFLIVFCNTAFAQDSLINNPPNKKLVISACLDEIIVYTEPGISLQYYYKKNQYFELRYGYRMFAYNSYSGFLDILSGPDPDKKHFSGYGNVVRFGWDNIFSTDGEGGKKLWNEFRFTYKDLFFPRYESTDYEGDVASSYAIWFNQSERRRVFVLNYAFNIQLYNDGSFAATFNFLIGGAYVYRHLTRYSVSSSEVIYNKYETRTSFRPSVGFEFALHVKAYEKKFKP